MPANNTCTWGGGTSNAFSTAANWDVAPVNGNGDDLVINITAAMVAAGRTPAVGPTGAITVRNVTITVATAIEAPACFTTSGGGVLSWTGALTYTVAAGTLATGSVVEFGNTLTVPLCKAGATGVFTLQPSNNNSVTSPRQVAVSSEAGGTITLRGLAHVDPLKVISGILFHSASVLAGTTNYGDPTSPLSFSACYSNFSLPTITAPTAVLNFWREWVTGAALTTGGSSNAFRGTANVHAPILILTTSARTLQGVTLNCYAPATIYDTGGQSSTIGNCTINQYAALALANVNVAPIVDARAITAITKSATPIISCANGDRAVAPFDTITLAGLTGEWAPWNGVQTVLSEDSTTCTLTGPSSAGLIAAWAGAGATISKPASTLTINNYGYSITTADVTGNVVINNGTANASYDSIVAPADKVLKGTPRWTTATGANIGTLERKVQELKI